MTDIDRCYQLVKRPHMSEKAQVGVDAAGTYCFRVPLDANKVEIRQAVERVFSVKVKKVNTLRSLGKWKIRGRSIGRTRNWKKAVVTLQEGHTIEIL